jgi:hypothetical protein
MYGSFLAFLLVLLAPVSYSNDKGGISILKGTGASLSRLGQASYTLLLRALNSICWAKHAKRRVFPR